MDHFLKMLKETTALTGSRNTKMTGIVFFIARLIIKGA